MRWVVAAMLLTSCSEVPKSVSCEDRIEKIHREMNENAGTCFELGACLGQKAAITTDGDQVHVDGQTYTAHWRNQDGSPIYRCVVGKSSYLFNETGPAFRGCQELRATGKCGKPEGCGK